MLLRHSLGLELEAGCVERAVSDTLDDGVFSADLASGKAASTAEVAAAVLERIDTRYHVAELRD